jgi:hypothetical protein
MRKLLVLCASVAVMSSAGIVAAHCGSCGADGAAHKTAEAPAKAGCTKDAAKKDCAGDMKGAADVKQAAKSGCASQAADVKQAAKSGCASQAADVKQAANAGCASKAADVKQASKEGYSCPLSAGKAAHDKVIADGGCEKSADAAFKKAMAEKAYSDTLAETGCSKTAAKAAYQAVLGHFKCEHSARDAARQAMAQAAYEKTMAKTGCAKSAQDAYDEASKEADGVLMALNESQSESAS